MIHQPMGSAEGQASYIEITAREIGSLKEELYNIIAKHSKQSYDKVWESSDRDFWMKADRSEEHTSELQSLMRISYAVFCLKKKKTTKHIQHNNRIAYKVIATQISAHSWTTATVE